MCNLSTDNKACLKLAENGKRPRKRNNKGAGADKARNSGEHEFEADQCKRTDKRKSAGRKVCRRAAAGRRYKRHGIADSPDIYGSDTAPIPTLEFGRKSGKVPRGFYYIIKEWTREKGLNFASESERGTFAYFVARKIAREGTKRNMTNADVYSTPVMNAKDRIEKAVKANLNNTLMAALTSPRVVNLRGAFTN